jgi:hypothetical protein
MKYAFMDEQRGAHSVEKMAQVLGVARSCSTPGSTRNKSARAVEEKELIGQIQEIQGEVSQRYGSSKGSSPESPPFSPSKW